jgi:hypothetical protein
MRTIAAAITLPNGTYATRSNELTDIKHIASTRNQTCLISKIEAKAQLAINGITTTASIIVVNIVNTNRALNGKGAKNAIIQNARYTKVNTIQTFLCCNLFTPK